MPDALWFTDDPEACKLLAHDPFALLVGFAIDQQVTVQKAFAGPLVLQERVGTLDPRRLAERELASVVSDEYGGDASRIWTEAADSSDLKKRIGALPGFGEMKVKSLSAVLAKQFGVAAAESIAPNHPTLGDVTSPEELERYQQWKRDYKKASKGS